MPHGTEPTQHRMVLEVTIPRPGGTFADDLDSGGKGPELVVIPAGRFNMGCTSNDRPCNDDERPQHEVSLRSFALSKHEVTFAQWDKCVAAGGCRRNQPSDEGWGRGSRPAINVSWHDAQQYAAWLSTETGKGYRLPSESEWEYAARGQSTTKYSWANRVSRNLANCDGCGSRWDGDQTAPVGSFAANGFGLHDMHGNVWEWVQDCWNGSYRGAPVGGSAWVQGDCARRVLRGGSWDMGPRFLRTVTRGRITPGSRLNTVGVRVVRTLTP